MAGITNREFDELAENGMNYLTWASGVEIVLTSRDLLHAIGKGTSQVTDA
jgi:hypothetical protein